MSLPSPTATVSRKATHAQTRSYNERLVLRTVYDRSPISRAEVARLTGLTRTSVSDVVGTLLDAGLAEEIGRGPSTGGKAPILLRVVPDAWLVIGIEVAETEVRGALVDLRGGVHGRRMRPIESADGDATLDLVHALVAELAAEAERPLLGIGVATPGLVDLDMGIVRWSVHLDWRDVELGRLLAERHGLPALVANDSQAVALAEYTFGDFETDANIVVVKVGRGIGSGIILGGRLYTGDSSGAGEIGHLTVGDGPGICGCGRRGCLETFAGSQAILARAQAEAAAAPSSALATAALAGPLTIPLLAGLVRAGDEGALAIAREAGRSLGMALSSVLSVLDVERIVLVGSVPELGEPWLEAVRGEVGRRALPDLGTRATVSVGNLGPDVAILGASALLLTGALGLSRVR